MIPATVSTLEVIRLAVALAGIYAAWTGRGVVRASRAAIPTDSTDDIHERSARAQRDTRMELLESAQFGFLLVHVLLLVNVLVNFGYAGSPIEQPNVLTSNAAQVLIPIVLTRLSERITLEIQSVSRLHVITGPRHLQEGVL